MTLPLSFRPEVQDEIDAAFIWYEQQRVGLGDEFMAALRAQLERLQENPELYAMHYRTIRASPMRRFPYVVYYRIDPNRILVIAIQHGKQKSQRWRHRA